MGDIINLKEEYEKTIGVVDGTYVIKFRVPDNWNIHDNYNDDYIGDYPNGILLTLNINKPDHFYYNLVNRFNLIPPTVQNTTYIYSKPDAHPSQYGYNDVIMTMRKALDLYASVCILRQKVIVPALLGVQLDMLEPELPKEQFEIWLAEAKVVNNEIIFPDEEYWDSTPLEYCNDDYGELEEDFNEEFTILNIIRTADTRGYKQTYKYLKAHPMAYILGFDWSTEDIDDDDVLLHPRADGKVAK